MGKMKQDADIAIAKKDSIQREFKRMNEDLNKSAKKIDSSNRLLKEALEQKLK
jgi:hypothetical protein